MDAEDADMVMLKRPVGEVSDPLFGFLGKRLSEAELEAFGKARRSRKWMTIGPMFQVREIGRKNRKPVLVPFVGVQGSF